MYSQQKPMSILNVGAELFNSLKNDYKKMLPLRLLFLHSDGGTAGPKCFSRPIGKSFTVKLKRESHTAI